MITTQPGTTFEATVQFASGLTGTVGVRIRDNQGNDSLARTTTGISADVTVGTRSVYRKDFTAPVASGSYTIVWDDTTNIETEELVVTASTLTALTGQLYVTVDELKSAFSLTDTTFADDDISLACYSASRGIDRACSLGGGDDTGLRFFYTSDDTRYFTPEPGSSTIEIDDLTTLTTLEVDIPGTGTFTEWTDGTHFTFQPRNAAVMNRPYERIKLRTQRQTWWPRWEGSIRITGTFGWSEIPAEVRQFAKFFAGKLLYRTRHAPLGILNLSADIGQVARLARTDPDFDPLIGDLVRSRPFV